jgi:hypothetical protein
MGESTIAMLMANDPAVPFAIENSSHRRDSLCFSSLPAFVRGGNKRNAAARDSR